VDPPANGLPERLNSLLPSIRKKEEATVAKSLVETHWYDGLGRTGATSMKAVKRVDTFLVPYDAACLQKRNGKKTGGKDPDEDNGCPTPIAFAERCRG